jgi:hypothetical protein
VGLIEQERRAFQQVGENPLNVGLRRDGDGRIIRMAGMDQTREACALAIALTSCKWILTRGQYPVACTSAASVFQI